MTQPAVWGSIALVASGGGLVVVSGIVLTGQIERVAARLRMSAGLLGIVSALGADAPEISSAVSALTSGRHDVGIDVVLGSNIYNLAFLLGLSTLVTHGGGVHVGKRGLWLNGGVGLAITIVAGVLLLRLVSGWLASGLVLAVLLPYVALSSLRAEHIEHLPLPAGARRFLCAAVTNVEGDARRHETPRCTTALDVLSIVTALVSVVLGSFAMTRGMLSLGNDWGISHAIMGVVLLAALTGLPNTIAAVQLARHGRGTAVFSEALNSNSLNVLFGLCLPAAVAGPRRAGVETEIALGWLLALTIVTLVLGSSTPHLRRKEGLVLLALYAAFVVVVIAG